METEQQPSNSPNVLLIVVVTLAILLGLFLLAHLGGFHHRRR
jgi:hypothetical protein